MVRHQCSSLRLLLSIVAVLTIGALSACSGTSSDSGGSSAAPTSAPTFPTSGTFIADIDKGGKKVSIGIAVDGADIAAYACNGTDDEAWFFGSQSDGRIDITSRFRDTLEATFDGAAIEGDLRLNGVSYPFTAAAAQPPAGVYTAELDGVRASWVMRQDGSAIGVQFNGGITGRDLEQAELQQLKEDAFRVQVRNKRQLQQAAQLVTLGNGATRSTINGRAVSPTLVRGGFRLG
jgi:hypothetical protein